MSCCFVAPTIVARIEYCLGCYVGGFAVTTSLIVRWLFIQRQQSFHRFNFTLMLRGAKHTPPVA
jgi:hypothetical protein